MLVFVCEFESGYLMVLRTGGSEDGFDVVFDVGSRVDEPRIGFIQEFIAFDACIAFEDFGFGDCFIQGNQTVEICP